jgi:hypothetical protein
LFPDINAFINAALWEQEAQQKQLSNMKRLYLMLIAAIACGVGAMAQDSRVATLQHGTNFRTYYGTDAFISAHTDAADGDVITLTEGEFNCPDVTKALTIRGEGMRKTILKSVSGVFNIPKDCSYPLCFEGLRISSYNVRIRSTGGSASALISKCDLTTWQVNCEMCNVVIADSDV